MHLQMHYHDDPCEAQVFFTLQHQILVAFVDESCMLQLKLRKYVQNHRFSSQKEVFTLLFLHPYITFVNQYYVISPHEIGEGRGSTILVILVYMSNLNLSQRTCLHENHYGLCKSLNSHWLRASHVPSLGNYESEPITS